MARKARNSEPVPDSGENDPMISSLTTYLPHRDELCGPTHGDNVRHAITRVTLMQHLLHDEGVQAMYGRWAEKLGIWDAARDAAEAFELLAHAGGFEGRGEMFEADDDGVVTFETDDLLTECEYVRLMAEAEAAGDRLVRALCTSKGAVSSVVHDAFDFVRSHDCDWPWLAQELFDGFLAQLHGMVIGRCSVKTVWVEPADLPAPDIECLFRTPAGATVSETLEAVCEHVEAIVKQLEPFQVPIGAIPHRSEARLKRNATWLYRHRVRGESIRSIAITEFDDGLGKQEDRRKDVRRGIRQAEAYLSMTNYCLIDTP